MADITSGVAGLIISTGLIVLFGEVSADLPAAGQLVFSGSALLAHSVSQQITMLPAYKRLSTLQNGHFLHTDTNHVAQCVMWWGLQIVPQAVCTRHGLRIGASLIPLVKVFT